VENRGVGYWLLSLRFVEYKISVKHWQMSNLIEISGDDIATLGDSDLRILIGLLCEADYRSANLPTKGVTWGGHQDARDGGLDVVVRDDVQPPETSFVPRKATGFQVKKPNMPRAEILKEMRPGSVLREEIKALIQENGAYIIVSSNGSTTDSALRNRVKAMQEAVKDEKDHQNLHLDFLDRGRVATWVRNHPSLILWVRNKIGRPLEGWQAYDNWANAPGGIEEEYLLDDGLRLHDGTMPSDNGLPAESGLLRIRSILLSPGKSVRLTGLSGVGKTRFVQALFDSRLGEQALNPSQAIYTDISDSPTPDPCALAKQLISSKTKATLIVDNCPPDLHHRLTEICSKSQGTLSILTIEYDVRDDLPEETDVFRLEPASEQLIEKLIAKRYLHVSQVDARTIADFSGGNARIAIALANTLKRGETLTGLRDEQLFERLFWQRHKPSESLLVSAEVCALVYSFEGTDVTSKSSELNFLASLTSKSGADLYRDVTELKNRSLIQTRSVWRAVLPHAIANRLARRALESIPKDTLIQKLFTSRSERLIKSFTRRLNYLHDCEIAVEIARDWLNQDGWIGKSIDCLSSFGIDILKNIAPISPEDTLTAIERAASGNKGHKFTSRDNIHSNTYIRLLKHLAYDERLFKRCVDLLCRFALSEDKDANHKLASDTLKSLFYIYLSGTHASVESRADVILHLTVTDDSEKQKLGLLLLDAGLEAWHFRSSQEYKFGARPRDYGYHPDTSEEITHWFNTYIGICTNLALSGSSIAEHAKKMLSNKLRGLWTKGGMFDAVEDSVRQIHAQKPWNDAWLAIRGIIRFDSKRLPEEAQERLCTLEKLVKPCDLLEKARTYALTDQHRPFDLEDDYDDDPAAGWQRAHDRTCEIGEQVAKNVDILNAILPELVSSHNSRLLCFGNGLAKGSGNIRKTFYLLHNAMDNTPQEKRQISVVLGFLSSCAECDFVLYNAILDELLNDNVLGEWLPILQTSAPIDKRGVERLHEALDLGKAPIHTFEYLAYGCSHAGISDDDLALLLQKIRSKDGGASVAIEILKMRFHRSKDEDRHYSKILINEARDILATYDFCEERKRRGDYDYALSGIARVCLNSNDGAMAAMKTGQKFAEALENGCIYAFDYPQFLESLAEIQPKAFLDSFLGGGDIEDYQRRRIFVNEFERHENPLNMISDDELLSWCGSDPSTRYPLVASVIEGYQKSDKTGELEWKPIIYTIFSMAEGLDPFLQCLANEIRPMSWSGSRAAILERKSVLFPQLFQHENLKIQDWARSQYSRLLGEIKTEKESEDNRNRDRNESFE